MCKQVEEPIATDLAAIEAGSPANTPADNPEKYSDNGGSEVASDGTAVACTPACEPTGILRPGGPLASTLVLTQAALGAGVLALAYKSKNLGLTYMLCLLVLGGILTVLSMNMLGEAAIKSKKWGYDELAHKLFNPYVAAFTTFNMFVNCAGAIIAYTIIMGDIIEGMYPHHIAGMESRVFFTIIIAAILVPLSIARKINFLRHAALLGVSGIAFLIISVLVKVCRDGVDPSVSDNPDHLWFPHNVEFIDYIKAFSTVTFAYTNHFNVPQIASELKPAGMPSMRKVSAGSVSIAFVIYVSSMTFGMLAFGTSANNQPDLIKDLHSDVQDGNALVIMAMVLVLVSIICTYGFHMYPIRQSMKYIFEKSSCTASLAGKKAVGKMEYFRVMDIIFAITCIVVFTVIALVLPKFEKVVDFIGAFCAAYLSYVCPPLFVLKVRMSSDDFKWDICNIGCAMMMVLGAFFCIFGTVVAVMNG